MNGLVEMVLRHILQQKGWKTEEIDEVIEAIIIISDKL